MYGSTEIHPANNKDKLINIVPCKK